MPFLALLLTEEVICKTKVLPLLFPLSFKRNHKKPGACFFKQKKKKKKRSEEEMRSGKVAYLRGLRIYSLGAWQELQEERRG
jgi:hypothetical protein